MKNSEGKSASREEGQSEIEIHHDRTSSYRTYHVDGMRGGLSPEGKLTVDFYVERTAMPQVLRQVVEESGQLGDIVGAGGDRSGIVRESEGGLVMDVETAAQVYDWLGGKLAEALEHDLLSREVALELGIIDEES
jgi:hypothetical protein